jgi:predicted lipoprotein with Yx(FWY)xxD motif
MNKNLPTYTWLAGAALFVGALTACGSTSGDPNNANVVEASAPAASPTSPAPTSTIVSRLTTGVGVVATDATGLTLYRFDKDTNQPPTSACEGACLQSWIPLLVDGSPLPGTGIDGALLGTLTRTDGTNQATLKGWPLYRFVGDKAPGEANGEGVQSTWHAIAPDGRPVSVVQQDAQTQVQAPPPPPQPEEPAPAEPGKDYSSY